MPGQSAALVCGLRKALEGLLMKVAVDPQIAACPMVCSLRLLSLVSKIQIMCLIFVLLQGIDADILEAVYALSDPRAGKFFQETV